MLNIASLYKAPATEINQIESIFRFGCVLAFLLINVGTVSRCEEQGDKSIRSMVRAFNPVEKAGVRDLGGRLLLDRFVEATGAIQADKYLEFVGISTPTATISTNHAELWLNNTAKQLCAAFDDTSTGCFTTGSANNSLYVGLKSSDTMSGQKLWSSAFPSTFTYQVNVGSITGAGLAACGDSSHAIGYTSTSTFKCVPLTAAPGGTSGQIQYNSASAFAGLASFVSSSSTTFLSTTTFLGTQNADDAAAGYNGQAVLGRQTVATNAPTSTQFGDLATIVLTAGDWDVSGVVYWVPNGATWSDVEVGISTITGNSSINLTLGDNYVSNQWANSATTPTASTLDIPNFRVSLAASFTYILKYEATYTAGGPPKARGRISARRVR